MTAGGRGTVATAALAIVSATLLSCDLPTRETGYVDSRLPRSVTQHYSHGAQAQRQGRLESAERSFRLTLALDPAHGKAATNLSQLLLMRGAASEATTVLRSVLDRDPACENCWNNLVVAYGSLGDCENGQRVVEEAASAGATLPENLLADLGCAAGPGSGE